MDLTTVIGLIAGFSVILLGITQTGSLLSFFSLSSIMIVVGGTGSAVIINYPISELVGVIPVVKKTLFSKAQQVTETIATLVSFAE